LATQAAHLRTRFLFQSRTRWHSSRRSASRSCRASKAQALVISKRHCRRSMLKGTSSVRQKSS